jgi:hypothetical protein
MAALIVPAIASFDTLLYLGGPTSPPSYVQQGRIGNIKFNGVAIDMVDVSNQESPAHRVLGTLLKTGDLTFDLYWEPKSTQDLALFELVITAPPALQQWKVVWASAADGTIWAFNGYLSKFTPDASIAKALMASCTISVDDTITVTPGS